MAQLTRFEEDPELPGHGLAKFDNGEELYTSKANVEELLGAPMPGRQGGALASAGWAGYDPAAAEAEYAAERKGAIVAPGNGAGGGSGAGFSGAGGAGPEAAAGEGWQTTGQTATDPRQYGSIVTRTKPQPAGPAPGAPPPGGPPGMPGIGGADQPRPEFEYPIDPYVRGGGRPGVDPMRMRAEGVPVPQSMSTVTDAGAPYDPEMAALRVQADRDVAEAQSDIANTQALRAREEAARAAAMIPQLEHQAAIEQKQLQQRKHLYQFERAHLDKEINDFNSQAKIEPNRLFKGNAWATIGAAIAQGLGAYGASLGGGKNFAAEAINNAIERDIEAQRFEIDQGRISQGNKLAQLERKYGDLDQAQAALSLMQGRIAEQQTMQFAAEARGEDIQQNAALMMAELQRKTLEREQEFYNASLGKQKTTVSEQFIQPEAPQRGGMRAKTPMELLEERAKMAGLGAKITNDERTMRGEPEPGTEDKSLVEYGKKRMDLEGAKAQLEETLARLKAQRESGDIPGIGVSLPRGVHKVGALLGSETSAKALENKQALNKVINKSVEAVKGPASDADLERKMAEVVGSGSEEEVIRGLETEIKTVEATLGGLGATYGSDVAEAYERRKLQEDVRRSGKPKLEPR